ncbi:Zn(II)2Cys6 transcription factor [Candidatus Bathyarchaeota archaeon]|nr:Zn(II)2Cys6 transcription factor [Candidatus Bathyarchaeota archaeon]
MEPKPPRDCWPCRNRHVRCDQSQVPCAKCLKSGLECSQERPIRWVKGVAIRGKMQGRAYEGQSEKYSESGAKKTRRIVFKAPITGSTAAKAAGNNRNVSKRPGARALDEPDGV